MQRLHYLLAALLVVLSHLLVAVPSEEIYRISLEIPMRDGTTLPTDLYLPHPEAQHLPCILIRCPGARGWQKPLYAHLALQGYAVAIQDTRLCQDAQGNLVAIPFFSDGWGQVQDGYDTVTWLAKSPYTNGKIGTTGISAPGIMQMLLAPAAPPGLVTQYIGMASSSLYHNGIFRGGQLMKNLVEGWMDLYAKDPALIQAIIKQPDYNDFWSQVDSLNVAGRVSVPAVFLAGWYDCFLQGTLDGFAARQNKGGEGARGKQKLVIGPWSHWWPQSMQLGDFSVPESAQQLPTAFSLEQWFAHHLKGVDNGTDALPAVTYFVMGPFDGSPSGGNVWRSADEWPVPSRLTPFYFAPGGRLVEESSRLLAASIPFTYDPTNPVPTMGGHNLFLEAGPKDQRPIESREDVLLFTSAPLKEELEVTGHVQMKLFVETDVADTDVAVRLTDVYPDGRSILITEGITRLAGPEGPIAKGKKAGPLEVSIDLWSTSLVFAEGHRIRISVSGSNYPYFEKNLNRSADQEPTPEPVVAHNRLFMGTQYPSQLLLPVVRRGSE